VSVALVIQHVKSVLRIILSCVASLVRPYFSTLPEKGQVFREKVIEHKMRVLILSTILSEKNYFQNNSARCYHKSA
jgi:hypothetical protein